VKYLLVHRPVHLSYVYVEASAPFGSFTPLVAVTGVEPGGQSVDPSANTVIGNETLPRIIPTMANNPNERMRREKRWMDSLMVVPLF
jgi:hypothetical protein